MTFFKFSPEHSFREGKMSIDYYFEKEHRCKDVQKLRQDHLLLGKMVLEGKLASQRYSQ